MASNDGELQHSPLAELVFELEVQHEILWEIVEDQPHEGQEDEFVDALDRIAAIEAAIRWMTRLG